VWWNGGFHTVADPLRHFVDGLLSLTNPIGSVGDKVNVGIFRFKSLLGSLEELYSRPETTTLQRLQVGGGGGGGGGGEGGEGGGGGGCTPGQPNRRW
jgi:hypothetical protein